MSSIPGKSAEQSAYPKVILGVDTSLRSTGYAVIRMNAPGKYQILDCGVIRNKASLIHSECLYRIAGGIRELVDTFHPDTASIESAFVQKNIKNDTTRIENYSCRLFKRKRNFNGTTGTERRKGE